MHPRIYLEPLAPGVPLGMAMACQCLLGAIDLRKDAPARVAQLNLIYGVIDQLSTMGCIS